MRRLRDEYTSRTRAPQILALNVCECQSSGPGTGFHPAGPEQPYRPVTHPEPASAYLSGHHRDRPGQMGMRQSTPWHLTSNGVL